MKNIDDMTTPEMVEEYNRLTGKSIKKFSTRDAGKRQLAAARSMENTKSIFTGKKPDAAKKPAAKKPAAKKPAAKKPAAESASRSEAVKASWANKKIAEARAARNGVEVTHDGQKTQYKSVKRAFEELGLPLGKHIAFRMQLKANGKAEFEGHKFTLTD